MSKSNYVIALYLRLSQEDEVYGESESIANQRDLLNDYVSKNKEFINAQVIEFSDDGYSGTNFNRPAVTDMLEKVRNGAINCIIVKDFSRFGRNFVEVGDYIEQILPFLGVRFISVNNNFDSKNHITSTGALDIAFKNLINDLYSKDISKKVRSAKQVKMAKGDFMSSGALYGYFKSAENKNQLIIDSVAATYVRRVFYLCTQGNSTTSIASILNSENIPTPLVYKHSIGKGRKWKVVGDENVWTRANVLRTLRDERYTGTLVSGKRRIDKVGSRKSVKVPQEDWIIVQSAHEPIITQKVFDLAQDILGIKQENNIVRANTHIFSKKIFCGHCRHALRRRDRGNPYYFCETSRYIQSECTKNNIMERNISETALFSIKKYAEIALSTQNIITEIKIKDESHIKGVMMCIDSLKGEIEKLKLTKVNLYENYKNGSLTKEAYLVERDRALLNISSLESQIEQKELECNKLQGKVYSNQFVDAFKNLSSVIELTPKIVQELISAIYVYDIDMIEIEWNFKNVFEDALFTRHEGVEGVL